MKYHPLAPPRPATLQNLFRGYDPRHGILVQGSGPARPRLHPKTSIIPTVSDFPSSAIFVAPFRVRSYELDGLGHLNHAVYLNYLEQARFDALAAGGFPIESMEKRGWGVHVVRIEIDYRRECRLGDRLIARTFVEDFRNTSMTIHQALFRFRSESSSPAPPGQLPPTAENAPPGSVPELLRPMRLDDAVGLDLNAGELAAEARVVAVWVGSDGKPIRIPGEVREALRPPEHPPSSAESS